MFEPLQRRTHRSAPSTPGGVSIVLRRPICLLMNWQRRLRSSATHPTSAVSIGGRQRQAPVACSSGALAITCTTFQALSMSTCSRYGTADAEWVRPCEPDRRDRVSVIASPTGFAPVVVLKVLFATRGAVPTRSTSRQASALPSGSAAPSGSARCPSSRARESKRRSPPTRAPGR